jgi:hypothetical protein
MLYLAAQLRKSQEITGVLKIAGGSINHHQCLFC